MIYDAAANYKGTGYSGFFKPDSSSGQIADYLTHTVFNAPVAQGCCYSSPNPTERTRVQLSTEFSSPLFFDTLVNGA